MSGSAPRGALLPALPIVLLLLALALPGAARAQLGAPLREDDRVRVTVVNADRVVGRFDRYADHRLHLRTAQGPVALERSRIARLEAAPGQDHSRGALLGAAGGLAAGLGFGILCSLSNCGGGEGANLAIVGIPLVTTPLGALLGWVAAPDRWVEVPLPPR